MMRRARNFSPSARVNRQGGAASLSVLEWENQWLKLRILPEIGAWRETLGRLH